MAQDQRRLRQREQKDQRQKVPDLEVHPDRRGKISPHRFVERRQHETENTPAQGELLPAGFRQSKGLRENILDEQPAAGEAAQQYDGKENVQERDLHLQEGLI